MNNLMGAQNARTASRIENDTESVKTMTAQVGSIIERITRHARALGYFQPNDQSKAGGAAPTPVISTMSDALAELARTIDHCSGTLNVFD